MIKAATYARENKVPYLGLCLGMQVMVIEFARHALNSSDPNSTEFNPSTCYPVIDYLPEQRTTQIKGGTMRLGAYSASLTAGSRVAQIYGTTAIEERHRHRYEVDMRYKDRLEACGLMFSGLSPDGKLPEIVEVKDHPWFIGVQFHPELKSKPFAPHPLFADFVRAAVEGARLV
jgi:CTP synthase